MLKNCIRSKNNITNSASWDDIVDADDIMIARYYRPSNTGRLPKFTDCKKIYRRTISRESRAVCWNSYYLPTLSINKYQIKIQNVSSIKNGSRIKTLKDQCRR